MQSRDPLADLQIDFSREALAEDYARDLYDYWCAARGAAPMPPLSAIDPMRMPRSCLPYMSILEVEHAPLRFQSRLSGTAMVQELGMNQTGSYIDEPPGTAIQVARLEWCVEAQKPYVVEDTLSFATNTFKRYQVLVLPFGDPQAGVQRIVGVFQFFNAAKAPQPQAV